jgi:Protein of unknown function (DUF3302)
MTSNLPGRDIVGWAHRACRTVVVGLLVLAWSLACPGTAQASLLPPELEDKLANFLAIFVLFFVPVAGIVVFWLLHVMPEKIAHKRHHPQFEAIRTLCLLSLFFGGLLWPIAWLWAYTRPVGYKMAFGTDKHPDYYADPTVDEREALADLKQRVGALGRRGVQASDLDAMRADLAALESRITARGSEGEDR